jgi:hypothetical protein
METSETEDPIEAGDTLEETGIKKPARPVSAGRKRFYSYLNRMAFRLLVGVLIFGLGGLLVLYTLYTPTARRLETASGELLAAQHKIETQQADLRSLTAQNEQLASEIANARLHSALLAVEVEVMDASLGVVEGNFSRSSLALEQADASLSRLAELVPARHTPVVSDLQARLRQAGVKGAQDLNTALPDLRAVSADLGKLKSALQAAP